MDFNTCVSTHVEHEPHMPNEQGESTTFVVTDEVQDFRKINLLISFEGSMEYTLNLMKGKVRYDKSMMDFNTCVSTHVQHVCHMPMNGRTNHYCSYG